MAERESHIESLRRSYRNKKAELAEDTKTLHMLRSQAAALGARMDKLKQERMAAELTAQTVQYAAVAKKLGSTAGDTKAVLGNLQGRAAALEKAAAAAAGTEQSALKDALLGTGAGATPADAKPAAKKF